ncbi:oxidoreductase [Nannocystaceae bacterium ST9]
MADRRPRLGVFKLASCDGCQLTLLDLEDELLAIAGAIDIVHFPEAGPIADAHDRFDLVLVEGSVSTPEQLIELREIRARASKLITIGACATAGGVQALRNFSDHAEFARVVYARPDYVASLATSTAVAAHVPVDFELRGCPISKFQLLELISATLAGRRPDIADESVCMECKRAGNVCVMVVGDQACLGPVTHAGCGALCPKFSRGCFGCFGPKEHANTASLADHFHAVQGRPHEQLVRVHRLITGWSEAFRAESERQESKS